MKKTQKKNRYLPLYAAIVACLVALTAMIVLLMLFSMSITAFAADSSMNNNDKDMEIDVSAKYEQYIDGIYKAELKNGSVSVTVADGVTVSISGVSADAKWMEVFPIPATEAAALEWMGSAINQHGILSHAYMISCVNQNGNRTYASGGTVSITCNHCYKREIVVGLNPDGTATVIDSANGTTFVPNGNTYFIIAEKKAVAGITVPVRGDENEIHADVTIDGDTVELHELDFDEIDHIVGDHVNTGIVEIDLTKLDDEITKIELPMASIKHIVEAAEEAHNDTETLQIDFPHGSVKLDDKTLRAIIDTVGEVTTVDLVLESVGTERLNGKQDAALDGQKVYGGYEAYLICNKTGVRVFNFKGGAATLNVPFEIPNGLKVERFAVWYVADDGTIEKMDTHYEDGYLVWEVGHFSDFIIVYEGDETPDVPGGVQTGDNSMIGLWVVIAVLSAGMIFFPVFWKKRIS